MITPRQFEERIAEIKEEYQNDSVTKRYLIMKLMADTLDTWGYRTETVRQMEQEFHG